MNSDIHLIIRTFASDFENSGNSLFITKVTPCR